MLLATAVVVVYLIFTVASNAIQSFQLGQDEDRLRDDVQGMQERYDRLTALRDYLNSDEYIEWVARRELGLVGPGEKTGIIVLSEATPVSSQGEAEGEQGQQQHLTWEDIIGQ
ncbi:MAG: septum formation initiator family protein [Dehalococcoidia bacterium]|nr:septum formation initiator family protein [Dehalococcoidia bacterium]